MCLLLAGEVCRGVRASGYPHMLYTVRACVTQQLLITPVSGRRDILHLVYIVETIYVDTFVTT